MPLLLVEALLNAPVARPPLWLMRQAGRYMPEYRALREKYSILEIIKTPELALEVTMQPIKVFELDAAIIFADILPPLQGMGLELDFVRGEGPVLYNPVRGPDDVNSLRVLPPEETLSFTLEAIKLARRELGSRGIPLIGFSGAPYTLAAYAVEGSGSRNYIEVKRLMLTEPDAWHNLMTKLSDVVGHYLLAQTRAGACDGRQHPRFSPPHTGRRQRFRDATGSRAHDGGPSQSASSRTTRESMGAG